MVNRVKINPKMMEWARLYAGFSNGYESQLPKEIKDRYKSWEDGTVLPTWNQLRRVSKLFKVPTAFFSMSSPPAFIKNLPTLINYRKLNNSIYKSNSPNLILNIRKSEYRRNIYLELLDELDEEIIDFNVPDLNADKNEFADYIRKILGVSLDIQKSWIKNNNSRDAKHYTFLNNWKEVITEKFGILIFETENVDIEEMRGLCIFHDKIPIILLNGKDKPNGRIFTLFHELTHLLLGESAICGDDNNRNMEIFCNSVAGEFLVPKADLLENINVSNLTSKDSLSHLSNLYGVSEHVILRRLLDINKINKSEYKSKTALFSQNVSLKSGKSRGNYLNNMIKYNGKPYYSLILLALDSGIINSLDFSKFTNLGQNQIPKLQDKLFGGV